MPQRSISKSETKLKGGEKNCEKKLRQKLEMSRMTLFAPEDTLCTRAEQTGLEEDQATRMPNSKKSISQFENCS